VSVTSVLYLAGSRYLNVTCIGNLIENASYVPTNKHGYIIPVLFNMGHCSNLYCPEQMILSPLMDATAGEMILVWASWMACI